MTRRRDRAERLLVGAPDERPSALILAPYLSHLYSGTAHGAIATIRAIGDRRGVRTHVGSFLVDDGVIPDEIPRVVMPPPPNRRLVWRVGRAFSVRDHVVAMRGVTLPRCDLMYTDSISMALAFAELFPGVRIVTHLGHVIGSREALADAALDEPWRSLDARIMENMESRCYRLPNSHHLVSTRLVAEQRSQHFGLPADYFSVHPLGIQTSRFSDRSQRHATRQRLGIDDDACVIITVSRLVKWKNIDWLVRAIEALPAHCNLLVVGDGPERLALQGAVPASAFARVHFVGHVDPVPMLAAGDVFALPSSIESFGIAYAEAMCMGLPCVGLRNTPPHILSTAQDVIVPGLAGVVVSDEASFREALTQLALDKPRRDVMGAAARRHALSHYSSEQYADLLEQMILDAAAQRELLLQRVR